MDSEKVTNESTGDGKTTKKTCNNAAPGDTVPQTNGLPGTSLDEGKKLTGISENQPRNVSFAAAVKPPTNSHSLHQGNLEKTAVRREPPTNPYSSGMNSGTLYTQRNSQNPIRVDKIIQLKKNNFHQHIHRYTL